MSPRPRGKLRPQVPPITFRISAQMYRALRERCLRDRAGQSDVIRDALAAYLWGGQ